MRHIDQLVYDMQSASDDQSSGIGVIRLTIFSLEKTALQNAALVEQSAAAADLLTTQAQILVAATSRFKVGQTASG